MSKCLKVETNLPIFHKRTKQKHFQGVIEFDLMAVPRPCGLTTWNASQPMGTYGPEKESLLVSGCQDIKLAYKTIP